MKLALCIACFMFGASAASAQDIVVKYTKQEAKAAIALYNIAVRSQGLDVAEAAVALTRKIRAASSAAAKAQQTASTPSSSKTDENQKDK